MLLGHRKLVSTALLVFATAFLLGLGNLLTETLAPPRAPRAEHPREAARSGDDGGFSVLLASPRDPYLLGRQTITIDPTIPAGDSVAQVDIFVDGRLVFTDRQPPYTCEADFGDTIRRHVIVAVALTRGGRRAKVSFVSRSSDLSDGARTIEIVPATVRDEAGRPVDDLSVSDFTVLENGARQRIVHFDSRPTPASIAVLLDADDADAASRKALLSAANHFAASLPSYQALAVTDTWAGAGSPLEFAYGRDPFLRRLDRAVVLAAPPQPQPLGEALAAAADGLKVRADQRVLVLLLERTPAPPAPDGAAAGSKTRDESLAAALGALKRAQVMLHVVVLGGGADQDGMPDLKAAAEESGGEFLIASSPLEAESAGVAVSETLLHQYLIGYLRDEPDRSGWRTIELKVGRPDLQIRARKGYTAG